MSTLRIGPLLLVAFTGAIPCLFGCQRHQRMDVSAQRGDIPDVSTISRPGTLEVQPSPASHAKVRVALGVSVDGRVRTLNFCYDESTAYDPQIHRIRMARVTGDRKVFEIVAVGDAFLWKDWIVGTVPRGFTLVQGDRLAAGVYEVYADAVVGEGALRVSIDNQGNIRSLPWDEFDKTHGTKCEPLDHAAPRIVPKPDRDEREYFKRRAQEARASEGAQKSKGR